MSSDFNFENGLQVTDGQGLFFLVNEDKPDGKITVFNRAGDRFFYSTTEIEALMCLPKGGKIDCNQVPKAN